MNDQAPIAATEETDQQVVTSLIRWAKCGSKTALQSMWQITTLNKSGKVTGQREEWRDVPIMDDFIEDTAKGALRG